MPKKQPSSQVNQQTPQQELEEILKKSGHNTHLKVSQILENAGWTVDLSAYYYDDTTEKPREIDITAKKRCWIVDSNGKKVTDYTLWLFVECKYFTKEIAFRMQTTSHHAEAVKLQGIPSQEVYKEHHYSSFSKVGKLYDTKENENNLFNAITQPVKALTFFKWRSGGNFSLYLPITVYEGIDGIYELEGDNISLQGLTKNPNSVFEIAYAHKDLSTSSHDIVTEYFFIEFLHLNGFGNYLSILEQDRQPIENYLKRDFQKRGTRF